MHGPGEDPVNASWLALREDAVLGPDGRVKSPHRIVVANVAPTSTLERTRPTTCRILDANSTIGLIRTQVNDSVGTRGLQLGNDVDGNGLRDLWIPHHSVQCGGINTCEAISRILLTLSAPACSRVLPGPINSCSNESLRQPWNQRVASRNEEFALAGRRWNDLFTLYSVGQVQQMRLTQVELDGDLGTSEFIYTFPEARFDGKSDGFYVFRSSSDGMLLQQNSVWMRTAVVQVPPGIDLSRRDMLQLGEAVASTVSAAGAHLAMVYTNWRLAAFPNDTVPTTMGYTMDAAMYSTSLLQSGQLEQLPGVPLPLRPVCWTFITAPYAISAANAALCSRRSASECAWHSTILVSAWTRADEQPISSVMMPAKLFLQDSEIRMTQAQREVVTVGHSILVLGLLNTTEAPPRTPDEAASEAAWNETAVSGATLVDIAMTVRRWGEADKGGILLVRLFVQLQQPANTASATVRLARFIVSDLQLGLSALVTPLSLSPKLRASVGYAELGPPRAASGALLNWQTNLICPDDSNVLGTPSFSAQHIVLPFLIWSRTEPHPYASVLGPSNFSVSTGNDSGVGSVLGLYGIRTVADHSM